MSTVPLYFFLDKVLYKRIRIIVSENILVAWNYLNEKRSWIDLSLVRKNHQKAFTLKQMANLLERSVVSLSDMIERGLLVYPSGRKYIISSRMPSSYYWSEDDVLKIRDQLYHLAPKNKYGEPHSRFKLVSRAQLLSKFRDGVGYYVKNEAGEYVRVWKAE